MTDLVEDYLRRVDERLRLPPTERAHVLGELKSHLQDKITDLQHDNPDTPHNDLVRQALADFGSPDELALAYSPQGSALVNRTTGETVLRVGRAAARSTARVLKLVAITCAGLLVLALVGGVLAYNELKPLIEKNAPYPVYEYQRSCRPCTGPAVTDTFTIHNGAREVRIDLNIHPNRDHGTGNGTLHLTITDANGTLRYDETYHQDQTGYSNLHKVLPPTQGDWRIKYAFENFHGYVDINVITLGLPQGRLWW